MKKLLILFLFTLISSSITSQTNICDEYDIQAVPRLDLSNESQVRFQISTSDLLFGESQVGPLDSFFYKIKALLISNDGSYIHSTTFYDPSLNYEIVNNRYVYNYWFGRRQCGNNPFPGDLAYISVSIERYVILNFNGFPQEPMLFSSQSCVQSTPQHVTNCATGGGNDDDTGEPNLTLTGVTVEVDGTTWDSTDGFGEPEPTFKYGKDHTFNLTIENDDSGDAGISTYEVYVSESQNGYPPNGSNISYYVTSRNVGAIDGNSETESSFNLFIFEDISTMQLQENTTYYMFIHLDVGDDVDNESNENDNIKHFPFKWENSSGRITLDTGFGSIIIPYAYTPTMNSVNLKLYDYLSPNFPVINTNLSQQYATVDISSLPSGKYIVHVNDQYERQIKTLRRNR